MGVSQFVVAGEQGLYSGHVSYILQQYGYDYLLVKFCCLGTGGFREFFLYETPPAGVSGCAVFLNVRTKEDQDFCPARR